MAGGEPVICVTITIDSCGNGGNATHMWREYIQTIYIYVRT